MNYSSQCETRLILPAENTFDEVVVNNYKQSLHSNLVYQFNNITTE